MTTSDENAVVLTQPVVPAARKKVFWPFFSKVGNTYSELLVCQLRQEEVVATHVLRRRDAFDLKQVTLTGKKDGNSFRKRSGSRYRVVLLLPKLQYLIRTLEIPAVRAAEADSMLRLETEALLPPDLGEVEISWRSLPAARDKHQKYEVYVARAEIISKAMATLDAIGLKPDFILPSAVVWHLIAARTNQAALLVAANNGDQQLEIASYEPDGSLSVRTIDGSSGGDLHGGLEAGLVESLRSLLVQSDGRRQPLTVGWIGGGRPAALLSDRVVFQDIGDVFPKVPAQAEGEPGARFLDLAAFSLVECADREFLVAASLVPSELITWQESRVAFKRIALGAGSVVLAVILVWLAFACAATRYRHVSENIVAKSLAIQAEGEEIGRRREQLRMVRTALATRNDLADILSGLHEATPTGVTYSQVDVDEKGKLKLHGQSESLAAAFLLPESLGKQPMFKSIQLLDAGQATRGAGAVTEFRIECRFVRQGVRP